MANTPSLNAGDARDALRVIVSDPAYGVRVLSSVDLMSALLTRLLPGAPRERMLLVAAARARVADALRGYAARQVETATAIRLAASSFSASTGLPLDACLWTAGELAIALGLAGNADSGPAAPADPYAKEHRDPSAKEPAAPAADPWNTPWTAPAGAPGSGQVPSYPQAPVWRPRGPGTGGTGNTDAGQQPTPPIGKPGAGPGTGGTGHTDAEQQPTPPIGKPGAGPGTGGTGNTDAEQQPTQFIGRPGAGPGQPNPPGSQPGAEPVPPGAASPPGWAVPPGATGSPGWQAQQTPPPPRGSAQGGLPSRGGSRSRRPNDPVSRAVRRAVRPGLLAFNPPTEMTLGRKERVEVGIARSPELRKALAAGLRGRGALQFEDVATSPYMGVELRGEAFEVTPFSPSEQLVAPTARWEFDIRPQRAGRQTLTLCVCLRVDRASSAATTLGRIAVPVLERTIRIRVDVGYGVRQFVAANWQWLIGTVLGLGGALAAWIALVH